jgi:predicted acyl esterase
MTNDTLEYKTETRDGMTIDWDVPIALGDGLVLRCDIYRPIEDGEYPCLLTYGPYGKYLHFEDGYKTCWDRMAQGHPDVTAGSTNKYQNWEVVDPEKWVCHGYVCVRVDSRGCGRSPGYVEVWSAKEAQDQYDCIEWAARQSWSNGRVGLNGISYYAMNQWQVASLQPPHLTAMCSWEGAADYYRDMSHHGGILCTFMANWYDMQVTSVQHGLGSRGYRSRMNGDWVAGPAELPEEQLGANREDLGKSVREHELFDEYWQSRMPDWEKVKTPFLSAANWGGTGLHPRGNFEAFVRAAARDKWLEVHGIEHWTEFYTDYGREIQKAFFDYYLKDEKNGWDQRPKVQLQVRHVDKFTERWEQEWPIARTRWTKFYLHPDGHVLNLRPSKKSAKVTYRGLSDGVTFISDPLATETEITGPLAAKLWVSSSTKDADLFLVFRVFTADFKEVVFQGALDPHTPIAQGWLRASHRKLDKKLSEPYRPYHTHDVRQPLKPGKDYELDIEIWPTSIVVPAGHRIALSVRGKDYTYPGGAASGLSNMKNPFTGVGPFLHNDAQDRPPEVFDGEVSLHFGADNQPYVLVPIVPER